MAEFRMPKLSDTMEEGTVLQWLRSEGDDVAKGEPIVEIESDKANMTVEAPDSGVLAILAQEGETLPVGAPIATIGDGAAPGARTARPAEPADETGAGEPGPADAAEEEAAAVVDEAEAAEDELEGEETETTGGIPTSDDGTGPAIGMALEAYPGAEDEEPEPEPAAAPRQAPAPVPARPPADDGDRVKASPLARRLAADLGIDLARVRGTGPAGRIVRADVEEAARATAAPAAAPQP
ncbi:MAG TPA: biotin/lipoyl-containing protein, partial [Miltoncostaeaceae bacterium]|nr:biotin/lipoyl-containing protein [Miltoncostaeaceae bacterium]